MVGMLVLMVMLGGLAGCGGTSNTVPTGTTPDVYTFTVTATGSPAVTPVPSTSFSVTVN
jgi:ABC-type glycerol-3-phosphate transport system substrate-binding protein